MRVRRATGTTDLELAGAFAEQLRDRLYREIVLGERPRVEMTLQAARARWWEEVGRYDRNAATRDGHLQRIARILAGRRLSDLDDAAIAELVTKLRDGVEGAPLAPATVNRYLTSLTELRKRAAKVWHAKVGSWDPDEHRQAEPPARISIGSHQLARDLIVSIVPHMRAPIAIECLTGLRKSELLGLAWERIDLEAPSATVVKKGDRWHTVTLPEVAVVILIALQPAEERRQGPVFTFGAPTVGCTCSACVSPARRGQRIKHGRCAFETARARIGRPELRMHDLRHWVASWLLSLGSIEHVRSQLGHASISTTARYSHIERAKGATQIEAATAALGELLRLPAVTATEEADHA